MINMYSNLSLGQYGINLHLLILFKTHSCNLIPYWTRKGSITYTYLHDVFKALYSLQKFSKRTLQIATKYQLEVMNSLLKAIEDAQAVSNIYYWRLPVSMRNFRIP